MNRKGFTLIELLAVIVLLGIFAVVTIPNISETYNNSKLKSEEIFLGRLETVIDSYIKLNSDEIIFTGEESAKKCNKDTCEENEYYNVTVSKGKTKEGANITFNVIISSKLLSQNDFINAGNKTANCNVNAEIELYKDSDYVYCFKVNKNNLTCLSEEYKNSITDDYAINTCTWSK